MSLYGQTKAWMRAVLRRDVAEREMQMEMAAHIEQAAERFVAGGMSEPDALHAARREFGAIAVIQEQARDSRGGRAINELLIDIRYALRYFARTPLTSLTIIFTLMLGIGLNAAVYSFAQGYLFNPPPGVPSHPSLVKLQGLHRYHGRQEGRSFSFAELLDYAAQPSFSAVAGWMSSSVVLDLGDGEDGVVAAGVLYVTPNYFSTLRLPLTAGPGFVQNNIAHYSKADLSVVLSYSTAAAQFGNAESAIGQKLRVNDAIVTVVGVAPPRFVGDEPNTARRLLFMPMSAMQTVEHQGNSIFVSSDSATFGAVAQLKPDVAVQSLQPVVANIAARHVHAARPDTEFTDATTNVTRLRGLNPTNNLPNQALVVSTLIGALDVIILLVCLTTVSSLLIGAAVTRRHEIGVRLALGASRWRIGRQLITETAILALIGAAGGLVVYYLLTQMAFAARIPIDVVPTWDAALFTATFAIAVAFLCGLSPALHATRLGLSEVLKNASPGATLRSRLQQSFVIAQIAFAQPLLVILGMTIFSLYQEARLPNEATLANNLIVMQLNRYAARNAAQSDAAIARLSARLSGVPGITGVISRPSTVSVGSVRVIEPTGKLSTAKPLRMRSNYVSTEYMALLGIKPIAGRSFLWTDTLQNVRPLVVRTDFAAVAFGGGNPIGRRVCARRCTDKRDTMEIIGVTDAHWDGMKDRGEELQALTLDGAFEYAALLIRTTATASAVVPIIRAIARREAPMVPLTSVQTIAELDAKERAGLVQVSSATAGAGMLTLLLACIGLYAVVALAVGQRKREIGIRIALGANPSAVVALFFKDGVRLSLIGLAIGLPLSAAVIRIIASRIGRAAGDPVLISAAIATVVLLVASLATWMPARKAAGVDPLTALRAE